MAANIMTFLKFAVFASKLLFCLLLCISFLSLTILQLKILFWLYTDKTDLSYIQMDITPFCQYTTFLSFFSNFGKWLILQTSIV